MSLERTQPLDSRTLCAIEELQRLILQHYPAATFEVQLGQDDPEAIHLVARVDLEDTDAVLDLVMDRMMEIQIEDEIPIFVIPTRPPERVQAMLAAARRQPLVTGSAPSQ
jgi:hypothetical protein